MDEFIKLLTSGLRELCERGGRNLRAKDGYLQRNSVPQTHQD